MKNKTEQWVHAPIFLQQIADNLLVDKNGVYVDATLGLGGHTSYFLKQLSDKAKIIAFDKDKEAVKIAENKINDNRVIFINKSYTNIESELKKLKINKIDGVLFDLGISSYQLDNPQRGFSFRFDGPLDMRFDNNEQNITAAEIINEYPLEKLEEIFKNYGEERFYQKIARAIVEERRKQKIETTFQLKKIIEKNIYRKGRIHPATKIFQALRIEVNQELREVEKGIDTALNLIKPNGVAAVITFHSLEDKIIKNKFKALKKSKEWQLINKKVITAAHEEIRENPRCKSAKLRMIKKI